MSCTGRIQDGIYNCFGQYDETMCYHCQHNDTPLNNRQPTTDCFVSSRDKIDELYQFLMIQLKLSPKKAFNIIYLLQEHYHVLPDCIEQCDCCKQLYDSESEGAHVDDSYTLGGKTLPEKYQGHWCGECITNIGNRNDQANKR